MLDSKSGYTQWSNFNEPLFLSTWCKPFILEKVWGIYNDVLQNNTEESLNECIDQFRYFLKIVKIESSLDFGWKDFRLFIEPKCMESQSNDKMKVSAFRWGVRLITSEGIGENHVLILIEGINNGFFNQETESLCCHYYDPPTCQDRCRCQEVNNTMTIGDRFAYIAHFYAPTPTDKHQGLIFFNPRIISKSRMWKRNAEDVQRMIEGIRDTPLAPFNLMGQSLAGKVLSMLNWGERAGSNCLERAKYHIRVCDIEIPTKLHECIVSIPRLSIAFSEDSPNDYNNI